MDAEDRAAMSLGLTPLRVDFAGVSLARRLRLYWVTCRELQDEAGMVLGPIYGTGWAECRDIQLTATIDQQDYLQAGWFIPPGNQLAIFTTPRPSTVPGRRPAGHVTQPRYSGGKTTCTAIHPINTNGSFVFVTPRVKSGSG